jgi:tetratricopeptide (TPR) repeat protein
MIKLYIYICLFLLISCQHEKSDTELYQEANSYYDSGNDSLCIVTLNDLLDKNPQYEDGLYLRAFSKHRSEKFAEAILDYSSYILMHPLYEDAYYFRAVAKYQLKDTSAISDYNKVIELNPKYGEAYNNRAIIYLNRNENEKACNDLKSAQKLGISNADSLIIKYCNSN